MNHSLVFKNTTFDVVTRDGDTWLRSQQISVALGYSRGDQVTDLYQRHADEFTDDMTALVKLPSEGGEQDARIFSPRGCYALAMFSRTKEAKAFRRWVLDVLESIRKTGKYETPYSVGKTDTLTKDEQDYLRGLVKAHVETLTKEQQGGAAIRAAPMPMAICGTITATATPTSTTAPARCVPAVAIRGSATDQCLNWRMNSR